MDLRELSLEEKEARERYHAQDKDTVIATGKGGAGNIFHTHTHPTPWDKHDDHSADGDRRGRDLKQHSNGVIHNVLRSISRAGRGDKEKSTERAK
jgi:diadenosine tetraphosphate (Ap4A) HIT family hydrolase